MNELRKGSLFCDGKDRQSLSKPKPPFPPVRLKEEMIDLNNNKAPWDPFCHFCGELNCIFGSGGIKCLKCDTLYCSCSVRDIVGVIDTRKHRHRDIKDDGHCWDGCDGELMVVMRSQWCHCAPLVE